MLFAIRESLARSHDATDIEALGGREIERDSLSLLALERERLLLSEDNLAGFSLEDFDASSTLESIGSGVADASCDDSLVAMAHEARHVRLHHHLLACYCLSLDSGRVHLLVMSQTKEAPCGGTLRKSERDGNFALSIGDERWCKECCLAEVFAKLNGSIGSKLSLGSLCRLLLAKSSDATHKHVIFSRIHGSHNLIALCHEPVVAIASDINEFAVWHAKAIVIEMAELHILVWQVVERLVAMQACGLIRTSTP